MHDRPPFLPFDDDEEAWPPEPHRNTNEASFPHGATAQTESERSPCPQCNSTQTVPRHVARRVFGAVGAAAGATGAIAAALSGAEVGAAIGIVGGPLGAACGSFAGAILAGLVAGAAGCATGAAFGEALDLKVLNNWRCLACGCSFTVRPN
ncbi:hypothetical protein [Burkholderia pseudomallei]|uniref:hypothetical protein n=1 Tax=Burkholderia pseudomallei TaxID=28450 RepID=UPI000538BFF7|nr:hypothetical protein [Burkholderia pseudomallei]KGW25147.1 hypothetical protein Y602_4597 [Burkholderia pseudomallei MSHR733]KGX45495.1 hypothetical protein Y043_5082 [Burkholderia pseudomallei MSHR2138]KGX48096.1 hypothetical protein Y600_6145 [Burkholderia pseudomallei MSHR3709]